jgi:hypothetical protein
MEAKSFVALTQIQTYDIYRFLTFQSEPSDPKIYGTLFIKFIIDGY